MTTSRLSSVEEFPIYLHHLNNVLVGPLSVTYHVYAENDVLTMKHIGNLIEHDKDVCRVLQYEQCEEDEEVSDAARSPASMSAKEVQEEVVEIGQTSPTKVRDYLKASVFNVDSDDQPIEPMESRMSLRDWLPQRETKTGTSAYRVP